MSHCFRPPCAPRRLSTSANIGSEARSALHGRNKVKGASGEESRARFAPCGLDMIDLPECRFTRRPPFVRFRSPGAGIFAKCRCSGNAARNQCLQSLMQPHLFHSSRTILIRSLPRLPRSNQERMSFKLICLEIVSFRRRSQRAHEQYCDSNSCSASWTIVKTTDFRGPEWTLPRHKIRKLPDF